MTDDQATAILKTLLGLVIDRMTDRLVEEGYFGFSGPGAVKAAQFRLQDDLRKRWRNPHPCLYPGCAELSVPRSHTVARSGPLAVIAQDGHVASPSFDTKTGRMSMKKIGVSTASTFPGFCSKHELIYAPFEQTNSLTAPEHHSLQFFRIACRELRIKEEIRNHLAAVLSEHKSVLASRGEALLREEVAKVGGNLQANITKLEIPALTDRLEPIRDAIQRLSKEIGVVTSLFLEPLRFGIEHPSDEAPLAMHATTVDVLTPVALAGQGNFTCAVTGEDHDVRALLSVWPEASSTNVAILVPEKHHKDLHHYIELFTSPPMRALSMIEAWMVHGSDHWFLQPKVWESIPQDRQERILADLWDLSRNIGMEYERSIFDELRKSVLAQIPPELASAAREFIERERQKLTLAGCQLPEGRPALREPRTA